MCAMLSPSPDINHSPLDPYSSPYFPQDMPAHGNTQATTTTQADTLAGKNETLPLYIYIPEASS